MPPRGHSSSSRSSSSRSSSSRSSRSSSSHNSVSRSSGSRSSGSLGRSMGMLGGLAGVSRGPSTHSSSSRNSRPAGPQKIQRPASQSRPRFNQPKGFRPTGGGRPSYYYGRRHDYVFFPVAWTDETTGTSYEKGYYDENGTRYENVAFENNGKYENVMCHCSYCGQDSVVNLSAEEVAAFSLKCPNCSAPMEIASELDAYDGANSTESGRYSYAENTSSGKKRRRTPILIIGLIVFAVLLLFSRVSRLTSGGFTSGGNNPAYNSGSTLLTDSVRLRRIGANAYQEDTQGSDKVLTWDESADSYYDEDSNCWLWYNTDVEPSLWQYWYEGISSDFGDYGWMEHDANGWYIEESAGHWIDLPAEYDTGNLWYIE